MDLTLLRFFNQQHTHALLDALMLALTTFGLGALPGIGAVLWVAGRRRVGAALWVTLLVGLVLTLVFQVLAGRPRPAEVRLLLPTPLFPSFPSGHAVAAFSAAVLLGLVVRRGRVWAGLGLLAAGIAGSRVYLGVHYPSDILGGAVLGSALGAAGYGLLLAGERGARRWRWLLWPQVALILLATQMAWLGLLPWPLLRWPGADKVLHALLFGTAVFWLTLWWGARALRWQRLVIPLTLAVPFTLALAEELLQKLSPRRTFDPVDLLCDALGMVAFWWLAQRLGAQQVLNVKRQERWGE